MALMVRRTELCNGSSGVMILSRDGGRYSYYNVILVRKRKNFKLLSEHGNAQREQRILHTCIFGRGCDFLSLLQEEHALTEDCKGMAMQFY